MDRLTEVVESVGVGPILISLLHKLEVMRGLVDDHTRVFPATVDDVPKAFPRVFLHKELRWHIVHVQHLGAVPQAVHSHHAHSPTAAAPADDVCLIQQGHTEDRPKSYLLQGPSFLSLSPSSLCASTDQHIRAPICHLSTQHCTESN